MLIPGHATSGLYDYVQLKATGSDEVFWCWRLVYVFCLAVVYVGFISIAHEIAPNLCSSVWISHEPKYLQARGTGKEQVSLRAVKSIRLQHPGNVHVLSQTSVRQPFRLHRRNGQNLQRHPVAVAALPPLHGAARRGDVATIKQLLSNGIDVDTRTPFNSTALMWAVEKRRAKAAAVLLAAGANPKARNAFGWSAWEYACETEATGVLQLETQAFAAAFSQEEAASYAADAQTNRDALLAAGADMGGSTSIRLSYGGGVKAHARLVRDGGVTLTRAAAERINGPAALRFLFDSAKQVTEALRSDNGERGARVVVVGGEAVSGVTIRWLGLYLGNRYRVNALEFRPAGAPFATDEPRVAAARVDDAPPPTEASPTGAWEMVAQLASPAYTPWGSTEVDVDAARLRTISSELGESLRIGVAAAIFPLFLSLYASPVRLVSVDGLSMLPTLRPNDVVLVDMRATSLQAALDSMGEGVTVSDAPVVWLDSPPVLRTIALELGQPPPPRNARFLKRLVAKSGAIVAIEEGTLVVNGVAATELQTCTLVGCKTGPTKVAPTTVPEGGAFVLGDNRGRSSDSTLFGAIDQRALRGVVRGVVWPPTRARWPL